MSKSRVEGLGTSYGLVYCSAGASSFSDSDSDQPEFTLDRKRRNQKRNRKKKETFYSLLAISFRQAYDCDYVSVFY